MSADPLLLLTVEALVQLTNAGLVKRAQRELESAPPIITRGADGTLEAQFPDGTHTRFAPGSGLREAQCSCGAAQCRHRLMVVLGWQQARSGEAREAAPLPSPGRCDDERLRDWAGAAAWNQALRLRSGGLLVDLEPGPPAVARLPQATVHFHGGDDPTAAQSDAQPADHRIAVVLGIWAFRESEEAPASVPAGEVHGAHRPPSRMQVQLGGGARSHDRCAAACDALLASLFRHGIAEGHERHAPLLAAALEAAHDEGATWLWLSLEALAQWLAAFTARSARFAAADGLVLLAEICARARAGRGQGALAAQHALGIGEKVETALGRVRLRSLGLRITGDGEGRRGQVALLDADTATGNALTLEWDNAGLRGAAAVQRAGSARAGGQSLSGLARGQLVTVSAHRRADGQIRLGAAHGGRTSLMPQSADWSDLPPAMVLRSLDDWQAARSHLPPRLLQPRHALARFVVLAVSAVEDVAYDPAVQAVHARLADHAEGGITLVRSHASACPGALDALAQALTAARPVRWIAGTLSDADGGAILDPWALSDGSVLTVPDLAVPDDALHDLPLAPLAVPVDPLQALWREVGACVAERLLSTAAGPRWGQSGAALVARLQDAGCARTASALQALLAAIREPEDAALARSAGDLLLRLALAAGSG